MNKKILEISCRLNAKKDSRNEFGNYSYRTAEKIYESLKPLLHEMNITLTFSEDVVQIGNKLFLKCTAYINDNETKDSIERHTIVEIDEHLKGMTEGQKIGASISYARKYLLCGIFLIDNGEDLDKVNNKTYSIEEKKKMIINQINSITSIDKLNIFMKKIQTNYKYLYDKEIENVFQEKISNLSN